jgi:TetR/AcrR family tetracycline transcriptional repressor
VPAPETTLQHTTRYERSSLDCLFVISPESDVDLTVLRSQWSTMITRPEISLDRQRLIAAAFLQLNEDGLEGLSMRRLATRLGVQAPALYWHVGDKAELLGLMARDIYAAAYAGVPTASEWREWLRYFGHSLRKSFASHRDGARLCAVARPPSPTDAAVHASSIAAPLKRLGLGEREALTCQASVISFTLGWATFEANGPMRDFLRQMMDFDATFSSGLDALVSGL